MVGATGFEPATSWSQTKCSSQAELRSDKAGSEYPIKHRFRNQKVRLIAFAQSREREEGNRRRVGTAGPARWDNGLYLLVSQQVGEVS